MLWMKQFKEIYDKNVANIPTNGLCPVFFLEKKIAAIITITEDGEFVTALTVPTDESKKNREALIPITEESAVRTSDCSPHAVFDNLQYCAKDFKDYYFDNTQYYEAYMKNLAELTSEENCPVYIKSIYKYLSKGSVVSDLISIDDGSIIDKKTGEVKADKKNKPTALTNSMAIVFSVQLKDNSNPNIWTRKDLIDFYQNYYRKKIAAKERDFDTINEEFVYCMTKMPTNIRFNGDTTKLISKGSPVPIGYESASKAFSVLRWICTLQKQAHIGGYYCALFDTAVNSSVNIFDIFTDSDDESENGTERLKGVLTNSLLHGDKLDSIADSETVYFIAIDSDSDGRSALCAFEQLSHSSFFNNLNYWQSTMYMIKRNGEHYTPNPFYLIDYTFGRTMKKDEKHPTKPADAIRKKYFKQLLNSIIFRKPISRDFVTAILHKVNKPQCFDDINIFKKYCYYAEAIIRKYYIDYDKGDVPLKLDTTNTDRSYLFGRLLATAEFIEGRIVDKEKHTPAAIRFWTRFSQDPAKTWIRIRNRLNPYMTKIRSKQPGQYIYYNHLITEIEEMFSQEDFKNSKPLSPMYLIGYNNQKDYIYTKKEKTADTDDTTEAVDEN